MRSLVGLALALFILAGCSAVGLATQPNRPKGIDACTDERFEDGVRVLSCAEAVTAAEAALGAHWPISSATFERNGEVFVCPPNARCAAPMFTSGVVRFEFWVGDPVRLLVGLDGNGVAVVADEDSEPDRGLQPATP